MAFKFKDLGFILAQHAGASAEAPEGALPVAASCALCGGAAQLPHMNCANLDCNRLFLACGACKRGPGLR